MQSAESWSSNKSQGEDDIYEDEEIVCNNDYNDEYNSNFEVNTDISNGDINRMFTTNNTNLSDDHVSGCDDDHKKDEESGNEGDERDNNNESSSLEQKSSYDRKILTQLAHKLFPAMNQSVNDTNGNSNNNITNNDKRYNSKDIHGGADNMTKNVIPTIKNRKIKILKDISNNRVNNNSKNVKKKIHGVKEFDDENNSNINDEIRKNVSKSGNASNVMSSGKVQEKLLELEEELRKFRKDNEALSMQKSEHDKYLKLLKKELAEFEMKKKVDKEEFEKYKSSEVQKLKKDRKIFENYKVSQENMFSRESRKEIDALKSQLEEVRSCMKEKDKKHQATMERMKERMAVLEEKNDQMSNEIALRETERCDLVQQLEALKVAEKTMRRNKSEVDEQSGLPKNKGMNVPPNELPSNLPPTFTAVESSSIHLTKSTNSPSNGNNTTTTTDIVDRSILADGSTIITYSNGTTKTTRKDGHTTTTYFNGDTKDSYPDGKTVYYYANSKTKHHTFTDGTEVYYFQSGQTEKHYPVGTREVTFPDGTIKYIDPHNACEETIFVDGSVLKTFSSGRSEIEFANGQREVHHHSFRRRDYPDGTSKTLFNDGSQQTTYSSGRVRVKDALGNVIFDGFKS